jgi:hypothetical protein
MIEIYTGKPGRGKTYRAVYEIAKESTQKKYFVIHNIAGLKKEVFKDPEQVKTFEEIMQKNQVDIDTFLSIEFLEMLCLSINERYRKPVLLVIDEAYDFFGQYTDQKMSLLAKHRHAGLRIMLIVQNQNQIFYKYKGLIDYEIRAKLRLFGHFIYQKIEGGENTGKQFIPIRKKNFDLYKSYQVKERAKLNLTFAAICAVIIIGGSFYAWRSVSMFGKSKKQVNEISDKMEIKESKDSNMSKIQEKIKVIQQFIQEYANYSFVGSAKYPYQNGYRLEYIIRNLKNNAQYELKSIFPNLLPVNHNRDILQCIDLDTKTMVKFLYIPEIEEKKPENEDEKGDKV